MMFRILQHAFLTMEVQATVTYLIELNLLVEMQV